MTVGTAAATGAAIGVLHVFETDHLAAVAALVDGETDRPTAVGASWGVGHAAPIAVVGLVALAMGRELEYSAATAALLEALVGGMLIYLGARMLWPVSRGVDAHDHGGGRHAHLTLGAVSLGLGHHHVDEESLVVGIVHGLAGSGAMVVLLVTTYPTVAAALSFLAGFTALSVLTMAVVSALWGRTLGTAATTWLETLAGVAAVVVGVLLVVERAVGVGPV